MKFTFEDYLKFCELNSLKSCYYSSLESFKKIFTKSIDICPT